MLIPPEAKKYWPFAAIAVGVLYVGWSRRAPSTAGPRAALSPLASTDYGTPGQQTASAYGQLGDPNAFFAALQGLITQTTTPVTTTPAPVTIPAGGLSSLPIVGAIFSAGSLASLPNTGDAISFNGGVFSYPGSQFPGATFRRNADGTVTRVS